MGRGGSTGTRFGQALIAPVKMFCARRQALRPPDRPGQEYLCRNGDDYSGFEAAFSGPKPLKFQKDGLFGKNFESDNPLRGFGIFSLY